jgi:hypothetical protein
MKKRAKRRACNLKGGRRACGQKRAKALRKKREAARKRFVKAGGLGKPGAPKHVRGSRTSREAADSLSESSLAWLEEKVFKAIRRAPVSGLTDEELERRTGRRHQSASARRRALVIKGWVRDSGMIRRNKGSGRFAIAWVVGREEFVRPGYPIRYRSRRPSDEEILKAIRNIKLLDRLYGQGHGPGSVRTFPSSELRKTLNWLNYLATQS